MTDRERMAALAETLKRLSDELYAVADEFSVLAWPGHATQTLSWAGHASLYANQLEARAVEIVQGRDAYFVTLGVET